MRNDIGDFADPIFAACVLSPIGTMYVRYAGENDRGTGLIRASRMSLPLVVRSVPVLLSNINPYD